MSASRDHVSALHARVDQTEAETRWNTYTVLVIALAAVVFGLRLLVRSRVDA